jgi:hemolysin activation/secretion protein
MTGMRGRFVIAAALMTGVASLGPGPAQGQGLPALPGPSDPSRIEQRFERPPTPQSTPEPDLPAPEQAPPPERADAVRFRLNTLTVSGNSVFSAEELATLWAGLPGNEVSLTQIYQVRDRLTAHYRNAGYVLSQAVIPAQRIRGGEVRLEVVEGFINEVKFEGEFTDRLGILQAMARKIKASRPLHMGVLERYVMLADDLPGMTVRTVLEAAEGVPGGSDLTFVLERAGFNGSLAFDNRGTRTIGKIQATKTLTAEDQLGIFDRTVLQGVVAQDVRELRYLDLSHAVPLDGEGTTLTLGVRRSWSRPGAEVKPLDIDSLTGGVRVGLSHPFIRSRSQTLRGDLGFALRNSRSALLGRPQSEDRLRVLSASLSYDISDDWGGSNLVQLTASKGLNLLDATRTGSPTATRVGGRSDFAKYNLILQRNQPITDAWAVIVAAEGQYSADRLLSAEEFGVGGKTYGRAFDSSEITGDSGASAKLETTYLLPPWQEKWLNYSQLYLFGDYGWVWNHEDGSRHGRQALASYGGGLRVGLFDRTDAFIELAFPTLRNPSATDDRGMRAFFSISTRF